MTHPSPSLLDAIAEICKWHSRVELLNPSRKLRDGGRQAILPPEIPDAIRKGEIEVPEELIDKIWEATARIEGYSTEGLA